MPPVTVTHFVTEDGKIQIDVTNVSGRPQPASRDFTAAAAAMDNQLGGMKDQDEPYSLIVSLRASHPQFFFYRGPQPKLVTSNAVASPLRALNGNGGNGGGAGGSVGSSSVSGGMTNGISAHRHHGSSSHRRTGSALWGHEIVDPTILEVSRQSWKEHNFLPVAPDPCPCGDNKPDGRHRSENASNVNGGGSGYPASPLNGGAGAGIGKIGDNRPLLVREEMADCVLLPGERRTFFIEVSNPNILARLLAQRKQAPPRNGSSTKTNNINNGSGTSPGQARLPPVTHLSNGSDREDDSYQHRLLRDQTDVFHTDSSANGFVQRASSGLGARAANGRAPNPPPRNNNVSGSVRSDGTPPGFDRTLPGELNSERIAALPHRPSWGGEDDRTDTDGYGRSSSRQPLSIVGDSATTRGSAELARGSYLRNQQQRASGVSDSLRSSRDYVVPPMSSSDNSESTFNNNNDGRGSNFSSNNTHGEDATADRYSPPSLTQFPVFYVYYGPLGDENKCVDRARKWIAKEQHAYHEWRESVVRNVVEHERKREHVWSVTEEQTLMPPQPRLEVKRILPPVLGELVRWRNDDGSSGCENDPMELSPVTVAAFHYYFTRPLTQAGSSHVRTSTATSDGKGGPVRSLSMLSSRHTALPDLPPSFAASRTNRTSKKAKKMFGGDRMGAGTVVMPLRVSSEAGSGSSARRASGTFATGHTPIKVPDWRGDNSNNNNSGSRPAALQLQQQQQQQRGTSQLSRMSESSTNAAPAPQSSMPGYGHPGYNRQHGGGGAGPIDEEDETDFYAGSVSPSDSAVRENGSSSYTRRPRFRTGRGLALLDDSVSCPMSPSAYCTSEAAQSSGDYPGEGKQSFLAMSTNSSSRWGRTETLDPEAAELAARNPPPPRDGAAMLTRKESRPSLPSFPSTLDGTRGSASGGGSGERGSGLGGAVTSPDLVGTPYSASSAGRQLRNSNSSSHLNGQLSDDFLPPTDSLNHNNNINGGGGNINNGDGADGDAAAAASAQPGSFVAQLLQSFCGLTGVKLDNNTSTLEEEEGEGESPSPHVRDISSAPPQRVTYRRRNGAGNPSFTGSTLNLSNASLIASHSQAKVRRLVDKSKVAKGQVKDWMEQLLELMGSAAVQLGEFLQAHGPTAFEGFMAALNFLKDNVFTPENVTMMETVITPLVMVFAAVTLLYLLVFAGNGADAALPLLYSGGL